VANWEKKSVHWGEKVKRLKGESQDVLEKDLATDQGDYLGGKKKAGGGEMEMSLRSFWGGLKKIQVGGRFGHYLEDGSG